MRDEQSAKAIITQRAGGLLSSAEVAEQGLRPILSVPAQDGAELYPACQFRDGEPVPGLAEVLAAMGERSTWVQLDILVAPGFKGAPSIMDLINDGRVDEAVAEVRRIGKHGA
jgi:hypothetical protein